MGFLDEKTESSTWTVDSSNKAMLHTDRDDHKTSRSERCRRAVSEFIGQRAFETAQDLRLIVPVPVDSLRGLDEDRR